MSHRPTTIVRNQCTGGQTSINAFGYCIIGDTSAAILYAKRLLANGVITPITILTEGIDSTNVADITNTDFSALNVNTIFHYMGLEKIHNVTPGDQENEDDPDHYDQIESIYHYARGAGPLGDVISPYYIPRPGPWFDHSTNSRLQTFFLSNCVTTNLSNAESIIANRLRNLWSVPLTPNIIVKTPSIGSVHHVMVQGNEEGYTRELFLNDYNIVNEASNVTMYSGFYNLAIARGGCTAGVYNVSFTMNNDGSSKNFTLSCVRVLWKTNPYTYLRLATEAGLDPRPIHIPASYRFVTSIPINGNTGITGITGGASLVDEIDEFGDLITTDIPFSLPDLNNSKNTGLTWLAHAYTTPEDVSITCRQGKYSSIGNTLLIVEAVCVKNRRSTEYLIGQKELKQKYNNRIHERNYVTQFAKIASDVYLAYTGITLDPQLLIQDTTICSTAGQCSDADIITEYSIRESPVVTALEIGVNLYNNLEIYQAAGGC